MAFLLQPRDVCGQFVRRWLSSDDDDERWYHTDWTDDHSCPTFSMKRSWALKGWQRRKEAQ